MLFSRIITSSSGHPVGAITITTAVIVTAVVEVLMVLAAALTVLVVPSSLYRSLLLPTVFWTLGP